MAPSLLAVLSRAAAPVRLASPRAAASCAPISRRAKSTAADSSDETPDAGVVTRSEVIAAVAEKLDVSKRTANDVVAAFLDEIVTSTKEGKEVRLRGFGRFFARSRDHLTVYDFQTKEVVKRPGTTNPVFRPSKAFKDAVKGLPKPEESKKTTPAAPATPAASAAPATPGSSAAPAAPAASAAPAAPAASASSAAPSTPPTGAGLWGKVPAGWKVT